jgi:hypothetical protein
MPGEGSTIRTCIPSPYSWLAAVVITPGLAFVIAVIVALRGVKKTGKPVTLLKLLLQRTVMTGIRTFLLVSHER